MATGVEVDPIVAISLRGRIALGVACIEELAQHLGLTGEAFDELIEKMWRPVVEPPSTWGRAALPRAEAEIAALFSRALAPEALEQLRLAFNAFWNVRWSSVDPSPVTRARTVDFLRDLLQVLVCAGASPPTIDFFVERSPANADGFGEHGRATPPVFYREGLAWADLEPALRRGLCSISVCRRREAAVAVSQLGLPSQALELVLRRTARDPDPEVREHSLLAWRRLFSHPSGTPPKCYCAKKPQIVDFRAYLQERDARWTPAPSGPAALLAGMRSESPSERRRAIERCRAFLLGSPELCARVEELLDDMVPEVRTAAAIWITEAPLTERRLEALIRQASLDPNLESRAAAIFALGTFGPRAAAAVPAILGALALVRDPALEPIAFYGAEALESIGTAASEKIVSSVLSGQQDRTEPWLQSLALRPDLCDRLIDQITLHASDEEPWVMNRIRRAISILRNSAE